MVTPIGGFNLAIAAYNQAAKGGPGLDAEDGSGAGSFATMVKNVVDRAQASGQASDAAATAAITDKGDLTHVVTAVAEAELTLQTVVAVRDRVIEAYKDIMRMPI
jgi:flagellar hook-basal body complex protein FliE